MTALASLVAATPGASWVRRCPWGRGAQGGVTGGWAFGEGLAFFFWEGGGCSFGST